MESLAKQNKKVLALEEIEKEETDLMNLVYGWDLENYLQLEEINLIVDQGIP